MNKIIICVLLIAGAVIANFGQEKTNDSDRSLRSSGRVNPSTLAMEFDIPLGSYPGRGINVPISLSYSSKLWRMKSLGSIDGSLGSGGCRSLSEAVYGENSAAGWTTSLAVPYIEYTGLDQQYDSNGFPLDEAGECVNAPPSTNNYAAYIRRISIHLPSGETHELRADDAPVLYNRSSICPPTNGSNCDPNSPQLPENRNLSYYATDGSNIKYFENSNGSEYRLLMPDGSFYDFENSLSSVGEATARKAIKFTDRNGNYTSYNTSTGVWTDTLGRALTAPVGTAAPTAPTVREYHLPGLTGATGTTVDYKFTWKKLKGATAAASGLADFNQNLKYTGDKIQNMGNGVWSSHLSTESLFHTVTNSYVRSADDLFNPIVLTEIELPTGQKYKFGYDIFGVIVKIDYPTGGTETFGYGVIPPLAVSRRPDVSNQTNLGVGNRKLYPSAGQTGTFYEWLYSAEHAAPAGYKVNTTNPDGTISERFLHRANNACSNCSNGTYGYDNGLAGMAYEERAFSSTGKLMSRKLTSWTKKTFAVSYSSTPADWHPRVESEENIAYDESGSSVSAFTKYEYAGGLDNIETAVQVGKTTQYAFTSTEAARNPGDPLEPGEAPDPNPTPVPTPATSSLTPIRITETTYLINDPSITPATRDSYRNARLLNLVTASVVKDGADHPVSRSEMKYDESGSSPAYRGNPTTARVWDSTKGSVTNPNAYLETHAKFDYYGNQIEATDAMNVSTFTTYDGGYYAFPISVTTSAPDSSGTKGSSAGFTTTATFNFPTGLPISTTAANGLETRIEYAPATLRPLNTKTFYQNNQVGNQAETIYHDEPNNYWVKSRSQIDVNKWAESTTYYDGLGRAYKSEQADAGGNIFVEKEFDQDGRIKRVTNPYRANETKQWTTNVYDEASRVKEVVLPDGAKVKTDYGVAAAGAAIGITKQITDQAGKKRRGITDALGRMIRVVEDPDGQNLPTNYTFDTLGNLRKTEQGAQNRYFNYDSLGRLLYAKQPEQEVNPAFTKTDEITTNTGWSVKYEYDDNGNITKTTDARNVSITGTYDKFNRLTKRVYGGSAATPDADFYYDGTGLGLNPSAIPASFRGKTTKVTSAVSEARYTSFDNLGRLLSSEQRTPFADTETVAAATPRTSSYTYNLSGALMEETYPSGRVVKNVLDNDGELATVQSKKNSNAGFYTYAGNISYNTAGAVTKMRLGNGRWETAAYSADRQQVTQIGLGVTSDDQNLLKMEYGYGTNLQNNGSLRQQKITVPTVNGNSGFTAVQNYTYDELNRLQSASENIPASQTQTWKQTFIYDRYGNRTFDVSNNNTTTLAQSNNLTNPQINVLDNRFADNQGYGYDKAGNLTQDATSKKFIYDAENHQTEVQDSTNTPIGKYLYDGEGKRVKKISATETTVFVYNGGGALVAEYSTALSQTPQVSYLTADHLGSPRIITDQNGVVTKRQDYTAFGEETLTANRTSGLGYTSALPPTDNDPRQGYTGYQKDDESGLDFAQARYYNSSHGRFTSIDPLTASASIKNPQTFNRYSYVLNSPYKFSDPLGLLPNSAERSDANTDQDCTCKPKRKVPKKPKPRRQQPPPRPAPRRETTNNVTVQNNTSVNVQNNTTIQNTVVEDAGTETVETATINANFLEDKSDEVARSLNATFFEEQNIVQKASNNKEAAALKAVAKEVADTFDPQVQVSGGVSVGTDTSGEVGGAVQINLPSPAAVLSAVGEEAVNTRRDVANNRIEGANGVNLILANAALDMNRRGVSSGEIRPALMHIAAVGIAKHQAAVTNTPRIKQIP